MLVSITHSFICQICLLPCNMHIHSSIHHITLHTTHYHSYMSYLYGLHALLYHLYVWLKCHLLLTWLFTHPPLLPFPHPQALGHLPSSSQILHIPQIHKLTQASCQAGITLSPASSSKPDAMIMVSAGLPPIPTKIVNRIQGGLFVEMYELLPSTLTSTQYNTIEDESRKSKHRRELSIMEWVQSFGVYMAVVARTKPHRIPDLLGYQQQIIQASYNRQPGCWADYDRQFRLKASATSSTEWSIIDLNIWNDTFPDITTNHGPSPVQSQPRSQYSTQKYTSIQTRQSPSPQQHICLDWNDDPNPTCP